MASGATPLPNSPSSGEIPNFADPARTAEVQQKQQRVAEFLEANRFDAVLLQQPENFAWFTSGGVNHIGQAGIHAALFITPDARVLVTNNASAAQLFESELPGLGFQLKERPWQHPRETLLADICRGRNVVSDTAMTGAKYKPRELAELRLPLSSAECKRMRRLGRIVAHAVEATCRRTSRGVSEAEIAGELAHRLLKHEAEPVRMQIAADGRRKRFRSWTYGTDTVTRTCVISVVARKDGLCVGASRTVCFDEPRHEQKASHMATVLLQATALHFSQADWELSEVWKRVARIYEKTNHKNEWELAPQGEVIGYSACELPITPDSSFPLKPGTPLYWHPSVNDCVLGDTILVHEDSIELLTPMEEWPRLTAQVKGHPIDRPDILHRKPIGPGRRDTDDSIVAIESDETWSDFSLEEDSSFATSIFD